MMIETVTTRATRLIGVIVLAFMAWASLRLQAVATMSRLSADAEHKGLKAFATDRRGTIAIIMGFAMLPLIAVMGAAVDYSRMTQTRSAFQQAVDAAALGAVKLAPTLTSAALASKANAYVAAQFHRADAQNITITTDYNQTTRTLTVSGSASIKTTIMGVLGFSTLPISASAQASMNMGNLQLALVLDNTGSMSSSGKISALISASHDLLNTLQSAAGASSSIKVSIVPFDTHVNIGTASGSQPWMDWSYYDALDPYGAGADTQAYVTTGCTSGSTTATGGNNISTSYSYSDTTYPPGDNGTGKCKPSATVTSAPPSWTGCVIDRDQPYDVLNSAPTTNPATWHPGADCNLASLLPLTTDWTALHAKVDQMHASGSTDLTIGLVWGWDMLTPNVPLSTAPAASNGTKRIIVFLTDGENTKNAWSSNAAEIDARTLAVCNNIKQDGVKIYTIRVVNGNATLLQNCASDPSMFYDVSQSNQLAAAFASLTQQLTNVRLMR